MNEFGHGIVHAIVRFDLHRDAAEGWPLVRIAGIPLVDRHLLCLRKYGLKRVHIVCSGKVASTLGKRIRYWGRDDRFPIVDMGCSVERVLDRLNGRILMIDGGCIYHPKKIEEIERFQGDGIYGDKHVQTPYFVVFSSREGSCSRKLMDLPHMPLSSKMYVQLVISPDTIADAEKRIFTHLWKKTDGWFSIHVNRPVSTIISRRLVRFSIHPNWITFGTLLVGIFSGAISMFGSYGALAVGGILFQITSILDGVDGELARVKFQTSLSGEWLDTICDDLTNVFYLTGVTLGVYHSSGVIFWLWLGGGALTIYLITVIFMYWQIIANNQPATLLTFQEEVGKPEFRANNRRLSNIISILQPLIKRDFYGIAFMVVSLLGLAKLIIVGWFLGSLATLFFVWKAMGAFFLRRVLKHSLPSMKF